MKIEFNKKVPGTGVTATDVERSETSGIEAGLSSEGYTVTPSGHNSLWASGAERFFLKLSASYSPETRRTGNRLFNRYQTISHFLVNGDAQYEGAGDPQKAIRVLMTLGYNLQIKTTDQERIEADGRLDQRLRSIEARLTQSTGSSTQTQEPKEDKDIPF